MMEYLLSLGGIYLLLHFLSKAGVSSSFTGMSATNRTGTEGNAHFSSNNDSFGCPGMEINPVTGLPMVDCFWDMGSNPYGCDLNVRSRGFGHDA